MTCAGCLQTIDDRRLLNCYNCHNNYDLLCANISEELFHSMTTANLSAWKCVKCVSAEPKIGNLNTPLRGRQDNVTYHRGHRAAAHISPAEPSDSSSIMEVSYMENQENNTTVTPPNNFTSLDATQGTSRQTEVQMLVSEMRLFREAMQAMTNQLHDLRLAVNSLTNRLDGCDSRIDTLCARVGALESQNTTQNVQQPHSALLETIDNLRLELNDRDQDQLLNDVEISCVPEESGENTVHVAITLGQKLGVPLTEQDIVDATRVGRVPDLRDGVQGPAPRPRLVVVRLARRAVRDQLLRAARVRRGATTEGTGLPGAPCRFYINERLTPANRRLFRQARELKQHHAWRFAWTRDGKIFVRQNSGQNMPRHRIRTELDLTRVFDSLTV